MCVGVYICDNVLRTYRIKHLKLCLIIQRHVFSIARIMIASSHKLRRKDVKTQRPFVVNKNEMYVCVHLFIYFS